MSDVQAEKVPFDRSRHRPGTIGAAGKCDIVPDCKKPAVASVFQTNPQQPGMRMAVAACEEHAADIPEKVS